MRRKFYTKQDYEFLPTVGNKKRTSNVHTNSSYKVSIPKQLRLEPWDFEPHNPNGIQLNHVEPPVGNANNEFWRNLHAARDWILENDGEGWRRAEEDAQVRLQEAAAMRRVNPNHIWIDPNARGAVNARHVYQNPQRRGQQRRRDDADLNPDLADRYGGLGQGGIRRQRREIGPELPQGAPNTPARAQRRPIARSPGLAPTSLNALRRRREQGQRQSEGAQRSLDFAQHTQTMRNRNSTRFNPPDVQGLGGGLPPRRRRAEP